MERQLLTKLKAFYSLKAAISVTAATVVCVAVKVAVSPQPLKSPAPTWTPRGEFRGSVMPEVQKQAIKEISHSIRGVYQNKSDFQLTQNLMDFQQKYQAALTTKSKASYAALSVAKANLMALVTQIGKNPKLKTNPKLMKLAMLALSTGPSSTLLAKAATSGSANISLPPLPASLNLQLASAPSGDSQGRVRHDVFAGNGFRGLKLFNPPPQKPPPSIAAAASTVTCQNTALTDPSPSGDALTGSDLYTARTSKVLGLSAQLATPQAAFQYVRDQIQFLPHFGASQTADQIIQSGYGTAADKATLLIALFRAQNIPAHYVMGEAFLNTQDMQSLFHVVGDKPIYWAMEELLAPYFMDAQGNFDLARISHIENGNLIYHLPQVWVRAYIQGKWQQLDPMDLPHDLAAASLVQIPIGSIADYWLFSPDAQGLYVKPYSLIDELVRESGPAIRTVLGPNASLSDVGVIDRGAVVTPVSAGLPQNLPGVEAPCIYQQATLIPTEYKFLMQLQVGLKNDPLYSLMQVSLDAAQTRDQPLFISHTSGILGETSSAPDGQLQIRLGDQILASAPMAFKTLYNLNHIYSDPTKYSNFVDAYELNSKAGHVEVLNYFLSPVGQNELDQQIVNIQTLQSSAADRQKIMAGLLRLTGQMVALRNYENERAIHQLRATGGFGSYHLTVSTSLGYLTSLSDRELGMIPIGAFVDESNSVFRDYPALGDYTDIASYQNFVQARNDLAVSSSNVESDVWEELYGMPSISAIGVLQTAAGINAQTPGTFRFIKNAPLTTANFPAIYNQFGPGMLQQLGFLYNNLDQQKRAYSLTDTLVLPSGWSGVGIWLEHDVPADNHQVYIVQYTFPSFTNTESGTAPVIGSTGLLSPDQSAAASFAEGASGSSSVSGSSSISSSSGSSAQPGDAIGAGGGFHSKGPVQPIAGTVGTGQTSGSNQTTTQCPSPVNVGTGSMWHELIDFTLRGRTRETNLIYKRNYLAMPFVSSQSQLGPNWTDNWHTKLLLANPSVYTPGSMFWIDENGGEWLYVRNSDGGFAQPPGQYAILSAFNDHYELKKKGATRLIFSRTGPEPFGALRSIVDPHGETISLTYDSSGNLKRLFNSFTGGVSFNLDSQGRIVQILREREGFSYTLSYDGSGRLQQTTDFTGRTTRYQYNAGQVGTRANGLMNQITDPLGRVTQFNYYDNGQVFEQIEPGQAQRSYIYASFLSDLNTRVLDTDGQMTQYRFDSNYRESEVVHPDGSTTSRVWNNQNQVTQAIDELGFSTNFQYDSHGNLISLQKPSDPRPMTMQYDTNFDKLTQLSPLSGSQTNYTIDPTRGDVTNVQRSDGSRNLSLTLSYDTFGTPIHFATDRASFANGTDANGLLTQVFDARNPETRSYDIRGRITQRSFASGRLIRMTYDDLDRLVRVDDTAGPSILQTFDVADRLITRTLSDGKTQQTTTYSWDVRDRLLSKTDPLGRTTTYTYPPANLGCRRSNNPSAITDPNGGVTAFEYDVRNRLVRKVSPLGAVTRFEYNLRGNLTALTDANGNRTSFEYDGNGRQISKSEPVTITRAPGQIGSVTVSSTKYQFDDGGRLLATSTGTQASTQDVKLMQYDGLDRLTSVVQEHMSPTGTAVQDSSTYSYEAQLLPTSLKTATNGIAAETFNTEAQPPYQLTMFQMTAVDPTNPWELMQGAYNITPAPTSAIGSISGNTQVLQASYDSAGRLERLSGHFNDQDLAFQLGYDSFGRKSSVSSSDRMNSILSYHSANELINLQNLSPWLQTSEALSYDPNGNIVRNQTQGALIRYGYDAENRLTQATGLAGSLSEALQYDPTGNHSFDSFAGQGVFSTNQILQDQLHSYSSDADGRGFVSAEQDLAGTYQDQFTYRVDGKLSSFTHSKTAEHQRFKDDDDRDDQPRSLNATYAYDALGRRLAKRIQVKRGDDVSTFTQSYFYLGQAEQILFAQSGDHRQFLYLDRLGAGRSIDEHLGQIDRDSVRSYQTDHLGSVLNTDTAGSAHAYTPFGQTTLPLQALHPESSPVQYGFTGRELDVETGKYYYRARIYDPHTGRWTTRDPILFKGGNANLYGYVLNNPVNLVDPSGKQGALPFNPPTLIPEAPAENVPGPPSDQGPIDPGDIQHWGDIPTQPLSAPHITPVQQCGPGNLTGTTPPVLTNFPPAMPAAPYTPATPSQ